MKRFAVSKCLPALALVMGVGLPGPGLALPILPGSDLLTTPDGTAFVDTPFGRVDLKSKPIGPGSTDTIVERFGTLDDGQTGSIPVELVALSLVSVDPVDVGVGMFFDVFVTLDPSRPSLGEIIILSHDDGPGPDEGGGEFESFFDVFVQVDFVDPATGRIVETAFLEDFLGPELNRWSHTPQPGTLPNKDAGNFFPIEVVRHTGPHPVAIPTPTPVPEPATLALVGAGLALLGLGRRRRKAA